ncbi:RNA polymerase sigma factor [Sphingobacterium bambusae]|uniref:RNA polymerase sigma factor n=1 Tax=Sphingobacterium bambusae TaxID=662858 RepID=A0ABW6BHZ7_9SPHI|nr:sigma-70 family RNA polymerase sigma factor [Sphingobacterium bambusae]WPL49069.1 sigma-70 family RNA polymerase sigma factor [Sphingobacterium bambusae]
MSAIDHDTFRAIYESYWAKVYNYAKRIMEDKEAAEDIVQQVFVSLWERRATLHLDNAEAYLIQAVKFTCITALKKEQRYAHQEEVEGVQRPSTSKADELTLKHDLDKNLKGIIETLTRDEQDIFRMRFEDGLDNKTIAAHLALSEKTIRNKFSMVLSIVRQKLKTYGYK